MSQVPPANVVLGIAELDPDHLSRLSPAERLAAVSVFQSRAGALPLPR
jgi:hypothetical protein